jgi:hypothetical protein
MAAKKMLEAGGHPHPGAGADASGDLDISIASLRMLQMLSISQHKEPLHSLPSQISGFVAVLSPSHSLVMKKDEILNHRPPKTYF